MKKLALDVVPENKTTIRISKELSTLIEAYKLFNEEDNTKEKIIDRILTSHFAEFKKQLDKTKKML